MTQQSLKEYRNHPGLSQSFLKGVISGYFSKESNGMLLGSYLDAMLFSPELVEDVYLVRDFERPSDTICKIVENITYWDDLTILKACNKFNYCPSFKDETRVTRLKKEGEEYYNICKSERTLVSTKEHEKVEHQVKLLKEGKAKNLIKNSKSQVALYGDFNGVPIKGLLDMIHVSKNLITITDLKYTEGAFKSFKYIARELRYDIQLSFYYFLATLNYPGIPIRCQWLVIDKYNEINLLEMDHKDIIIGKEGVKKIKSFNYNASLDFKEEQTILGWEDGIRIFSQAKLLGLDDYNIERYQNKNKYKYSIWE